MKKVIIVLVVCVATAGIIFLLFNSSTNYGSNYDFLDVSSVHADVYYNFGVEGKVEADISNEIDAIEFKNESGTYAFELDSSNGKLFKKDDLEATFRYFNNIDIDLFFDVTKLYDFWMHLLKKVDGALYSPFVYELSNNEAFEMVGWARILSLKDLADVTFEGYKCHIEFDEHYVNHVYCLKNGIKKFEVTFNNFDSINMNEYFKYNSKVIYE